MKSALFIVRRPPYDGLAPVELLDTLFVAAAFDVPVQVLFLEDGLWQLVGEPTPESRDFKAPAKQWSSLPLYDVTDVFVDAKAMERFQLATEALCLPVVALDSAAIQRTISSSDLVFND